MRKTVAGAGSALFFLAAPGTVAGVLPWLLTGWTARQPFPHYLPVRIAAAVVLAAAVAVLVQAFARFVTEGSGTPAPVAAPDQLVVGGLYRYVRNPMYVAVITAIVAQAVILAQPVLLVYAALVWVVFASFVRWYEEPTLRRRFGAHYDEYTRAVRAWLPRLRPWAPGTRSARSP